ncbi:translocation/assembly module TamB domain-containing protein [Haloferula sp.]|uniref:translocation/assembly module TamB domain-containing protein n=1 Tax=Haloferula sp. TaxID=2497595 RepID=UPI003C714B78
MEEEEKEEPQKASKQARPRWRKKRWQILVFLLAFLVWLDGPGWRWIGEKAARHFLPGLGENFELQGRLTGGDIKVSRFNLGDMGAMEVVALDQVSLNYKLSELIKGNIQSLNLQGLHVEVDLAKSPEKEQKKDEEESDLGTLLCDLRQRILPVEIEIRDVSARIHRDGEELFQIEPTALIHAAGTPEITLDLGTMTILGDRKVEAQTSTITWQEESLSLSSLEVMPALAIRELVARIPANESMTFATGLIVDGVRFNAKTDLSTASLVQEDTPLVIHQVAEKLGFPIPAEATLNSLKIEARGLEGGLETLEADLQLSASAIDFDAWTSSRISLAAKLEGDQLKAVINGEALGSPLEINADVNIDREADMMPETAVLDFSIPELEKPLTIVRDRFTPSDEPVAPPAAVFKGSAELTFDDGKPDRADAKLSIISSEEAPPISIDAQWQNEGKAGATVMIPGVNLDGEFSPDQMTYSGKAEIREFAPDSLTDWLDPFGVTLPAGMKTSLNWTGGGDLEEKTHQGNLDLTSFEWQRLPEEQPIKAFATASYDWPKKLELTPLNVQQAAQKIEGDVRLENQELELRKLAWSDGEDTLLNGTAKIPVPEDFSDWKALLRETRPIAVDIESTELALTKLHPYLPEETRFRDDSRAKLSLKLSGSMAKPVLDTKLTAENVGILSQPDVPLIAIDLNAIGREETLKLEGDITSPDYPPVRIDAITNWDPDLWAENPEVIKKAKLDASAKIADFDLKLLSKFVPDARKLQGLVDLDVEVGGTVGEPEPMGTVTLSGGAFEMRDPTIPRIKDGQIKIVASPQKVTIENFTAELSGGTLDIGGSLDLVDGKPSQIDITINGAELPARRDDSMIVRLNTNLRISGPWEQATLGGQIEVVDSLFYKDIEILPIGVPFNQPSEPSLPAFDAPEATTPTAAVPEPFRNWSLDLRLLAKDPFLIRGNLASGRVFMDVAVKGTVGEPRPSGKATLFKVEAKLPFSTLKIAKGEITFRPDNPFDPVLNIRGEASVRPYELKVYIYGPVSNPKVLPTSNPPLPETEIMTLVATGTTTSGFADPEAATARAAQLLFEEIRNGRVKYLNRLGPVLKLIEKVDFQVGEKDPYTSTKYNSATFNLDDNWLVRAGISEEGNTRSTLIYLFRFR